MNVAVFCSEKPPWRLALLASRLFGVDTFNYSETERAYILSEKLTAFFKKLHLATTLAELKIDDMDFDAMATRGKRCGSFFYRRGKSPPRRSLQSSPTPSPKGLRPLKPLLYATVYETKCSIYENILKNYVKFSYFLLK